MGRAGDAATLGKALRHKRERLRYVFIANQPHIQLLELSFRKRSCRCTPHSIRRVSANIRSV